LFIILFLPPQNGYRSDDMTGQFTLAALEEEQYPITHRRVSDLEQGPTDYYDDQVKQEEEIGNVCMVRQLYLPQNVFNGVHVSTAIALPNP
jgi:hypothetical protein